MPFVSRDGPDCGEENLLIPKTEGDSTVVPQSLEITAAKIVFYTYFVLRIEIILPNNSSQHTYYATDTARPIDHHLVKFAVADDRGNIGDGVTEPGLYS